MSEDWKPGDLALCVSVVHPKIPGRCRILRVGTVYTVKVVGRPISTHNGKQFNGERALDFVEASPLRSGYGFPESIFRKIRPDKHEDCEPEFIELLNRIKRSVDA